MGDYVDIAQSEKERRGDVQAFGGALLPALSFRGVRCKFLEACYFVLRTEYGSSSVSRKLLVRSFLRSVRSPN